MSNKIFLKDHLGSFKVRLGINRNDYMIKPGLYELGCPNKTSDVIVTCNYKLTIDQVRSTLKGDYWLLVLDTDGVNVWCAAGKGSFGSAELIYQIEKCQLIQVVNHKRLILPQLGAPGIQSHLIKKVTGFDVNYGPVHIDDLETYIQYDYEANDEMRQVTFGLKDRMVLTPIEFFKSLRYVGVFLIIALLFKSVSFKHLLMIFNASFLSTLVFPAILPIRPFKMFYKNGILMSLLVNMALLETNILSIAIYILAASFSGYLALNFTGSTTFTSLSGVVKESKEAIKVLMYMIASSVVLVLFSIIGGIL